MCMCRRPKRIYRAKNTNGCNVWGRSTCFVFSCIAIETKNKNGVSVVCAAAVYKCLPNVLVNIHSSRTHTHTHSKWNGIVFDSDSQIISIKMLLTRRRKLLAFTVVCIVCVCTSFKRQYIYHRTNQSIDRNTNQAHSIHSTVFISLFVSIVV